MTITFKVGNELSAQIANLSNNSDTCRTPEQVAAFIKQYIGSDIVFFCNDPFVADTLAKKYNCTFSVVGYNTDGKMVAFRITPKGKVKGYTVMNHPDMTKYNMTNRTDAEYRAEMAPVIEFNKKMGVTNFTA